MTTDEFIVLCDGISCESKLQVKPAYEEEKVRIHDRLADASLERMSYREVLNLRTGFIYLSEIDDFKKYFAMVNDTLDTMTDYYIKIGTKNPAVHCRFYSMEQLYHLIRKSNNADDLHREIAEVYVSTGTQNFWNELAIRMQYLHQV